MQADGVASFLCLWVDERDWRPPTQVNVAPRAIILPPCLIPLHSSSAVKAWRAMNDLPPAEPTAGTHTPLRATREKKTL
jgi:hypothetical protein